MQFKINLIYRIPEPVNEEFSGLFLMNSNRRDTKIIQNSYKFHSFKSSLGNGKLRATANGRVEFYFSASEMLLRSKSKLLRALISLDTSSRYPRLAKDPCSD